MATLYADRVFIDIEGTVVECKEGTYNASRDQEMVSTMNRKGRGKGYVDGNPSFELSLVVPQPEDGHVVDFEKFFLDKTLFTTVFEYNGGQARTFVDCKIKEIDQSGSEGEGIDTTLTVDALDMQIN